MGRAASLTVLLLLSTSPAFADGPIVDRDYAIDYYEGVAVGDNAWVGMGGAGAALITGTAGMLINPAAVAVRLTTDKGRWNWDYHFDYLSGKYSSDYDNNGSIAPEGTNGGATLITGGLGLRIGDWAAGATFTGQTAPLLGSPDLNAEAVRLRFAVAKHIPQADLAIGVGVQQVLFQVAPPSSDTSSSTLFEINGTGLFAGFTYVPNLQNYRLAGAVESRILGAEVVANCDPENCEGYILPRNVVSPARVILGSAYRWAKTPWNQLIDSKWRDEEAVTVTADVLITGNSPNSYGIEAFGMQQLQRSGRHTAVSVRAGAEYEIIPGWIRLRAGSYWEPERFEGQGGRIHATVGTELRILQMWLFGQRRFKLAFAGDFARHYTNIVFSIGFWH